MGRATTAIINLDAIRYNYRLAKEMHPVGEAVAVIKADAYGHGAVQVAEELVGDVDAFAVACIEEALQLREAGITTPILLLEGFFTADELVVISQQQLWCVIHSLDQIKTLSSVILPQPIRVWLKMDSGMHRLGVPPEDYHTAYQRLQAIDQVSQIVMMSHFSSADELDVDVTSLQIACFDRAAHGLDGPVSMANSAALLQHKKALREWQRPGIMLYGASPFSHNHLLADQLKPAMRLVSEVIAVRDLPQGEAVGYGRTWVCEKKTRVGTVSIGYADGYPRHAKNGTPVLVNGQRTQIIGRVSMDMITIDLTDIEGELLGAEVELWGENLLATEVASYCDTISYTLFTGVTGRVRRQYA